MLRSQKDVPARSTKIYEVASLHEAEAAKELENLAAGLVNYLQRKHRLLIKRSRGIERWIVISVQLIISAPRLMHKR